MNTISILKKLITFYYYFAIFGFLLLTIGFPILFIMDGKGSELEFMDMNIDISNMSLGIFITIILIGAIILSQFIRAVYLFKKSLKDLSNGNYFSALVITNFKKIGQSFLIFGFGQWVYKMVVQLTILQDLKLSVDNTLFLSLVLGLFFLFLSEAFAKAKETKQENDLTI